MPIHPWADYIITESEKGSDGTITSVLVYEDAGLRQGETMRWRNGRIWKKDQVVSECNRGKSFMTATHDGKHYIRGQQVRVHGEHIQTTPNDVLGDNIGELPPIQTDFPKNISFLAIED